MSGLEVAAAVAGIVGAYAASATLYYKWCDKRAARKVNAQNQALEVSLSAGQTVVKKEYDDYVAKLGKKYAVGDDRTQAELLGYVVKLQHTLLTLMAADPTASISIVMPNYPVLMSTSEDTRVGVVRVLGEQFQRMAQARPLSNILGGFFRRPSSQASSSSTSYKVRAWQPASSLYPEKAQQVSHSAPAPSYLLPPAPQPEPSPVICLLQGFAIRKPLGSSFLTTTCGCGLDYTYIYVNMTRKVHFGRSGRRCNYFVWEKLLCHFHLKCSSQGEKPRFYCPLCAMKNGVVATTWDNELQMADHLRGSHQYDWMEMFDGKGGVKKYPGDAISSV